VVHDGCPIHFSLVVRKLNKKFANRWTKRRDPVMWPARSPNTIKFFMGNPKEYGLKKTN